MNTNTQIQGFEELYIVTQPGPESEPTDLVTHVKTFTDLQNQILGGLRAEHISQIFTPTKYDHPEQAAHNHAQSLLDNLCEICESEPSTTRRVGAKVCDTCAKVHDEEIDNLFDCDCQACTTHRTKNESDEPTPNEINLITEHANLPFLIFNNAKTARDAHNALKGNGYRDRWLIFFDTFIEAQQGSKKLESYGIHGATAHPAAADS